MGDDLRVQFQHPLGAALSSLEPIAKYGEIRCYIRDPDGYIIEVGQSTDLTYG